MTWKPMAMPSANARGSQGEGGPRGCGVGDGGVDCAVLMVDADGGGDLTRAQWRTYVRDVPYREVCGD
ncbi:hypothetical protein OG241_26960 [Streptomyces sp. NBC_01390]|uniref:hypothetical protein n=1 Tax=unclassified Streptomyces TaxID=2593676 RepID=UPI003247C57B|nr:hypothetical protein OG806_26050 [Streptomyces sp. NBC_00882]